MSGAHEWWRCVDCQLTANNLSVVMPRYHRSRAHANDRLTPPLMKIIFSRKGFDSQYGGVPSPILPDGTLLPLPIPSTQGRPLGGIQSSAGPLHMLVSDLTGGKIGPDTLVHLDPDLQSPAIPRLAGWLVGNHRWGRWRRLKVIWPDKVWARGICSFSSAGTGGLKLSVGGGGMCRDRPTFTAFSGGCRSLR